MFKFFKELRRDEEGATAIEYGLIAALLAIGLITAMTDLGQSIDGLFGEVETAVGNADGGDTNIADNP